MGVGSTGIGAGVGDGSGIIGCTGSTGVAVLVSTEGEVDGSGDTGIFDGEGSGVEV